MKNEILHVGLQLQPPKDARPLLLFVALDVSHKAERARTLRLGHDGAVCSGSKLPVLRQHSSSSFTTQLLCVLPVACFPF